MAKRKRKSPQAEHDTAEAPGGERHPPAEEAAQAPGEAAAEQVEEGAGEEAEVPEEEDPVARLEAEVASLKDQLLRALAETENLRRRNQREREDAVKYAAAPLIKDLIGVADNLRRALESVPAEAVQNDEQLNTLLAGVEMTEKELNSVFEKHGIVKIDPLGERLDPHSHEAVFEIPDPGTPAGTVLQVLRAGYRLHERLLRPAQVGVAKSAPSAPGSTTPDSGAERPSGAKGAEQGGDGGAAEGKGSAPGSRLDTTA